TSVMFNMRPGSPTNNRGISLSVRKASDYWVSMGFSRSVGVYDNNPGSNSLSIWATDGVSSSSKAIHFPNSPGPLPVDTMYFEIERDGDSVSVKASTDGDEIFEHEVTYTYAPGTLSIDQDIRICGAGWYGAPGGYADFDYIKVAPLRIASTIDVDPDTLNLKSKGKWITAHIDLPEGNDVNDINVSTVMLNDLIQAEWGDVQDESLMVKFDRSEVEDILSPSEAVTLTVSGELYDGTRFEGSDDIRVIQPG
ncbi:MAG: hypothetical protein ACE5KV_08015, partial [Thermoplasmata archaeon]